MPIDFESPQPFAPAAASAYGAAEIGQRNNAVLAGLWGDAAHANLQARLGTAQLQEQGAEARSREEGARGRQQQSIQEEARQFDQSRLDRQAAQEFAYRHEAAQSQQKAQLAAWLNDQELSQKEEQRLRQMQNSVADIQADTDLTPEERVAAITKLRTGIDVYEMRQRKALAKQEEAHAAAYESQAKRQTEIALKNADLNSKTLEERTVTIPTPEGQTRARQELGPTATDAEVRQRAIDNGDYVQHVQVGFDQFGHPNWKQVENHSHAAKQKAAADLDAIRLKEYSDAVAKAQKDVEAWAKQRDAKQAALAEKAGTVPEPLTPDQIHQNFLDTLAARGLAPSWEEQRQRMAARKGGVAGPAGQGAREPGSGQIPPAPPEKPFDEDKDASPNQRRQIEEFRTYREAVQKLPIPEQAKTDYRKATLALEGLLREHGSLSVSAIAAMPEGDRKRATEARETVQRIEAMSFDGGRSASPARQAAERVPGVAGPVREPGAHQRRALDVRPWLREHVTTPVAQGVEEFFTPRPVPPGGR